MTDPVIREKFTRDLSFARQLAKEYFQRYPKDQYAVESWRQIQSSRSFIVVSLRNENGPTKRP